MFDKLPKNLYRTAYYLHKARAIHTPKCIANQLFSAYMKQFSELDEQHKQTIWYRVNYYNRLDSPFAVNEEFSRIKDFAKNRHASGYAYDLAALIRYFPNEQLLNYRFGDIDYLPKTPCFVKSRPVGGNANHANAVLLKLNTIRHFYLPRDKKSYDDKKPRLVWRGAAHQANRIAFLQKYHTHPLCDAACTAKHSIGKPYHGQFMPIIQQLNYRFILSLEGNDVASNLKWIMASNSLCFMPKPRFETWFMENTLLPNHHYVLLRDDFTDLGEKIAHYQQHPEQAKIIIDNAHAYIRPFYDKQQETLIQLLVMKKFFDLISQ